MWYICKWRVAFLVHIYIYICVCVCVSEQLKSIIVLINLNYYMRLLRNDFSQIEGNVKRGTSPAKTVLMLARFVYSCLKDNRHSILHVLFTKTWLHPVHSKLLICRIESFANCLGYHTIAPHADDVILEIMDKWVKNIHNILYNPHYGKWPVIIKFDITIYISSRNYVQMGKNRISYHNDWRWCKGNLGIGFESIFMVWRSVITCTLWLRWLLRKSRGPQTVDPWHTADH